MEKEAAVRELLHECESLWTSILSKAPSHLSPELWTEHQILREKLEFISKIQKKFSSPSENHKRDRREALAEFIKWSNKSRIVRNGVTIKYCDELNGFELKATSPIEKGTAILQVPRKAIFSWDLARKSDLLRKCFETDVIVMSMENVALALALACEKLLPASSWKAYLNILPSSYDTPIFYTLGELKDLRPSNAFDDSLLLYRSISRQFIHFLRQVLLSEISSSGSDKISAESDERLIFIGTPFNFINFTFSLYCWAVSTVTTRINIIPSKLANDDQGKPMLVPALIPVFDMANHDPTLCEERESVYFSANGGCARITATKHYSVNESVNIYYGKRTNSEFLIHNGFITSSANENDYYKLKIGLPKQISSTKVEMFEAIGVRSSPAIFKIFAKMPPFDTSLVEFAKVFVLNAKKVEENVQELNSEENVKKARNFLKERFALLQNNYKLNDEMKEGTTNIRHLMISRLKKAEIAILKNAENYI